MSNRAWKAVVARRAQGLPEIEHTLPEPAARMQLDGVQNRSRTPTSMLFVA